MTKQELNIKLEGLRQGFKNLPHETQEERIYQLVCQIINEAATDYVGESTPTDRQGIPSYICDQSTIIEDLRNQPIMAYSKGMNEMVIHMLLNNPEQVKNNIHNMSYGCEVVKVETYDKPQFR